MHKTQHDISSGDSMIAVLYQQHAHIILVYIRAYVNSKEDAEDLLTEVFMATAKNQHLALMDEKEQIGWLRRVAHNKIIDHYRRTNRQPIQSSLDDVAETLLDEDDFLPEQVVIRNENHAQLQKFLASLPVLQQKILWLRFAQNLNSREIGQQLNKSDTAVRMLLSRTLNFLRSTYKQNEGEQTSS